MKVWLPTSKSKTEYDKQSFDLNGLKKGPCLTFQKYPQINAFVPKIDRSYKLQVKIARKPNVLSSEGLQLIITKVKLVCQISFHNSFEYQSPCLIMKLPPIKVIVFDILYWTCVTIGMILAITIVFFYAWKAKQVSSNFMLI